MKPNPGHCPPEAIGKRVVVRLANGQRPGSWPAHGTGACRWTKTGSPFDIADYEIVR